MEAIGINFSLLFVQLMALIALIFPILTLFDLARKKLTGTQLALWVLVICAVPLLGPLAYWIIRPTSENKN
jgi:hypothetical protein